MPRLNLKAQLTSIGVVNNTFIYLENLPTPEYPFGIPIGLSPKNASRKEWNNSNIGVEVVGNLDIQLVVHAFKGTGWTFKLINKDTSKELLSISGQTGSNPAMGWNASVVTSSVQL